GVGRKLPHIPDVSRCDSPVSVSESRTEESSSTIDLHVYPNPSSSDISIEWMIAPGIRSLIEIIDQSGRVVHTQSITEATGVYEWQTDGTRSGIYQVVLTSGQRSTTESIILQR